MIHAYAYFTYDSLIEVFYKTDSLLTNIHHVTVVAVTYFHAKSTTTGWEYICNYLFLIFLVLHFLAETSNPCIIIRTILKISD